MYVNDNVCVTVRDLFSCIKSTKIYFNLLEEWVLIVNPLPFQVAFDGWTLHDDGDKNTFCFPHDFVLPAFGQVTVWCAPGSTAFASSDDNNDKFK